MHESERAPATFLVGVSAPRPRTTGSIAKVLLLAALVILACGEVQSTLGLDVHAAREDRGGAEVGATDAEEVDANSAPDGGSSVCDRALAILEDCTPDLSSPLPPGACTGRVELISGCVVDHPSEACAAARDGGEVEPGSSFYDCVTETPRRDAEVADVARLDTSTPLDLGVGGDEDGDR